MLLFTLAIILNVLKMKLQEMDNKGQSAKCLYYRRQYNDWNYIKLEIIVGKGEIHFYSMIRLDKLTEECQAPTLQCPLQGDCHLMEVSGVLLKLIVLI